MKRGTHKIHETMSLRIPDPFSELFDEGHTSLPGLQRWGLSSSTKHWGVLGCEQPSRA
jgi:hypothetical protein